MSRMLLFSLTATLVVSGCASLPAGPSVMVLPGAGLSFDQFRSDDAICQEYASLQAGGATANQAELSSRITSAVVSTVLGAAAGAALGGARGAAVGAGTGLLAGSLFGIGSGSTSMYATQQQYDAAYIQCMYAKGHQVPVSGQFSSEPSQRTVRIPSPPAGSPPPPPKK